MLRWGLVVILVITDRSKNRHDGLSIQMTYGVICCFDEQLALKFHCY